MSNLFISWSGRRSQIVARALYDWLPYIIQSADPWLSVEDIEKGSRWNEEIASQLEKQAIGIICLTAENLNAPWLLFEAGALSKSIDKSRVCTFLLDIRPADVEGPLAQFQHTVAEKQDINKLSHAINKAFGDQGISDNMLNQQFEMWWPKLNETLNGIPKLDQGSIPTRTDRELLEEVLELVRSIKRPDVPSSSLEPTAKVNLAREIRQRKKVIQRLLSNYGKQISDLERKFPDEADADKSPELRGLRKKRSELQRELSSLDRILGWS